MSLENKGNESAFPRLDQDYRDIGLTKREYFAGLAMQGILSNVSVDAFGGMLQIAEQCIIVADALIAELNKEK